MTDTTPAIQRRIARNLSHLMRERGMTQSALARASGVSQSMISRLLRAERNVLVTVLDRLADGLRVDVGDLLAHDLAAPVNHRQSA